MSQKITERSGSRIALSEGKGDKYLVRLMGWEPGADVVEGSSGDYPVSVIKRDFAEAFPAGTRMKANHDGMCTEAGGDIRRIVAKTVDTPFSKEDGMYAHIRISQEWSRTGFFEDFADVIGLSISAGVEIEKIAATDDDGQPILDSEDQPVMVPKKSERGAQIVGRFLSQEESPYNTVDVVEAPGADGRIVARAFESAKETYLHGFENIREQATFASPRLDEKDSEAVPPRSNQKEKSMDEEERKALIAEMKTELVPAVVEALRPTPSTDESSISATVEAVVAAGLSEEGRADVYERIDRGIPVAEAIEKVRTFESAVEARVTARLAESAPSAQSLEEQFGYTMDEGTPTSESKASLEAEFEEAL